MKGKKFVINLIRIYQKVFSRDTGWLGTIFPGRTCRFHPTCSQYTTEAVELYGVTKGVWLGIKLISRCHPWNPGGHDPVPRR